MNSSSLRFGVIGAGMIGRIHLEALRTAGLSVVAVADPSAPACKAALELIPGMKTYADWRELLDDPEVEAVNICTLNALHFEILKEAVQRGKHVFCEKTMTVDGKQAHEALQLRPAPGQIVQIGYMKRFFPASIWAKERLPDLGRILCATVRSFQGGLAGPGMFDDASWRPDESGPSKMRRFASGGMLNMAGSHMLDLTAWLLGVPRQITCRTWAPDGYDAELHAHAFFEMESGAAVHFEACLSHFSATGPYGNGWDEFVQIDGIGGRLEIYYPLWNKPASAPARARFYHVEKAAWEEPEFPAVDAFHLELESFAQSCTGKPLPHPTIRDGAIVDFCIDTCYASARLGHSISFPQI